MSSLHRGLCWHCSMLTTAHLPYCREEWGNPKNKEYYDYIKSYSPVDNIRYVSHTPLHSPHESYLISMVLGLPSCLAHWQSASLQGRTPPRRMLRTRRQCN